MRRGLLVVAIAGPLLLATGAGAEGLDGTQPLVCELTQVSQCDGVASCTKVTPEQIDLPPVVQMDLPAKLLRAPDDPRTSPIEKAETQETVLLLQGSGNGRGWTVVIDRATGHLSASLADVQGGHVIAGACVAE